MKMNYGWNFARSILLCVRRYLDPVSLISNVVDDFILENKRFFSNVYLPWIRIFNLLLKMDIPEM